MFCQEIYLTKKNNFYKNICQCLSHSKKKSLTLKNDQQQDSSNGGRNTATLARFQPVSLESNTIAKFRQNSAAGI